MGQQVNIRQEQMANQGMGQAPHYYQFGTGYGGQAPLHPIGGANNLG